MTRPPAAPDPAGSGDQPPPVQVSSTRTRRVVFGLVLVLVVLVAGGAAVGLAWSAGAGSDGDDRSAAAGTDSAAGPAAGASAASGAPPGAGVPSAGQPPAPDTAPPPVPPDDTFRPVPRLCEEADFSPVFDVLAQAEVLNDDEVSGPTVYQRFCTFQLEDAGSTGTFRVDLSVYSSPDEAQGWFDEILAAEARGEPEQEQVEGWDANTVLTVAPRQDQAEVRFLSRDQTLLLNLSVFIVGAAADAAAQHAAVVDVAAQLRQSVRA